ncbi:MAG: MBL fold metallo-hydrolase [Candidatus Acidiferrales bacterium]
MRRLCLVFAWIACLSLVGVPAARAAKSLEIYFIDVEGGQSTLIVDPEGESLLIDTGWDDFNGRDANRIMAAAKDAGIDHIDDLILTHYHSDHAGGVAQLASRIKIDNFFDHGPNTEADMRANYATYEKIAAQGKRTVVKPGDEIPLKGIRVQVVASAGEDITKPLAGAGQPNSWCASEPKPLPDTSENVQSVGVLITFGKFRFIDLGDLTNQKELGLVCPNNLLGTVDLYLVTHHGTAHPGTGDSSNAPAIVYALHPRVAVMNNGAIKGGHPLTWQTIHDSPGLEGFWQLHYSMAGAEDHNVPKEFIANVGGNDEGYAIKVTAEPNAVFIVTNERNGYSKTYTK